MPTAEASETVAYVTRLPDGRMLYAELPEEFVLRDRSGHLLLRPPAVRILDQARAVALKSSTITPAYLVVLRQALHLTQEQFGRAVGVDKMTVYRWERGTRKPSAKSARRIAKLRDRRVGSALLLA
jgi:DNA-binding transcriptional regulator YiaG